MPSTRRDFMTGAATATAAALGSSVLPAIPDPTTASENRFRPRLIYYNDAHHFHAKRLDPPVSVEKLGWPVDELLGTGVDLLVLGLGYGDVYFHDSKVGRVVGQEKEVWENFIDWRIMCMVRDARKLGTDQLREVIRRGREKGLKVFPSLKLQDVAQPGDERCGWLKWRQHPEVCLKEKDPKDPRSAFGYDFTHPLVREDKLKMVREVLSDYGADGIELDFMFYPAYFRRAEVDRGASLMTRFVADVREAARAVGREQKRSIPISARVFHRRDENLGIGLDVESWLKEKSVDLVVGQVSDTLFETGIDIGWLATAANAAGAASYLRPPLRVYDERTAFPSIEMYRALGQNLSRQGCAGMYLGYLPWPLGEREYEILREIGYPEACVRRAKRYFLQPRERAGVFTRAPSRQLPVSLEAGKPARVTIGVSDDLASARRDGDLRRPILTLRFSFFCSEDDLEIRFNGRALSLAEAEVTDERALRFPVQLTTEIEAPLGMSAHWFRFRLEPDQVKEGENTLEVVARKMAREAGFTRSLSGVELHMRYKEFIRPEGIDGMATVSPLAP